MSWVTAGHKIESEVGICKNGSPASMLSKNDSRPGGSSVPGLAFHFVTRRDLSH